MTFKIEHNTPLTSSVYRMVLRGDTSAFTSAGQFVNIALKGKFLRRPISVCDYDTATLTLIYKVVGEGTAQMSRMTVGEELDLLTGLGNGFSLHEGVKRPLLVGGGVGVPPLYNLAKRLVARGTTPTVVLGFNAAEEVFYAAEFEALGCRVIITTADGSRGVKGFVTDALSDVEFDYFYACGPLPMLKALAAATEVDGEVSLEERMGCGFGACMGCSCMTLTGSKRICKEGPVFPKNEVIWNN